MSNFRGAIRFNQVADVEGDYPELEESPQGDYVAYGDYWLLLNALEALQDKITDLYQSY